MPPDLGKSQHFPNALIVTDRFHAIRLIQHQYMMIYRELSAQIKNNQGILALFRKRSDNLSQEKKAKRDAFLDENLAVEVEAIYQFQQQFYSLLMKRALTQRECRKVISNFLEMLSSLKQSAFKAFASLGKTHNLLIGTEGGTRTHTVSPPPDFESGASTNSATPARAVIIAKK